MLLKNENYKDYFPTLSELDKYYDYHRVPFLYFHFAWFNRNVIVARYRRQYGLYCRGWLPDFFNPDLLSVNKYEFCKEWHCVFVSKSLSDVVYRFKLAVRELMFKYSFNMSDLTLDSSL